MGFVVHASHIMPLFVSFFFHDFVKMKKLIKCMNRSLDTLPQQTTEGMKVSIKGFRIMYIISRFPKIRPEKG